MKRIGTCGHIQYFDLRNHKGRSFFSTDIHGHFHLLHEKLREVSFDSTKDLLFLAGDMTDRHLDSKYILDYLNEPWIHSIRGNHEEMVVSYIESISPDYPDGERQPFEMLYFNGGAWFFDLTVAQQMRIYETFKSLPLAIELESRSGKKVGIVHAEVPYGDWEQFKNITKAELKWNGEAVAQWARTKYDRQNQDFVKNIDLVLVGHTPTESGNVEVLGNVWYCDAGSFFRSKLNFFELE